MTFRLMCLAFADQRVIPLLLVSLFTLDQSGSIGLMLCVPFLGLTWYLLPHRATALEIALPIHGRTILLARWLTAMLCVVGPLLLWAVASRTWRYVAWADSTIFAVVAIGVLAVTLPQLLRVGRIEAPPFRLVLLQWLALGVASALALRYLPPMIVVALFGMAVLAACTAAWQRIPEGVHGVPTMRAPVIDRAHVTAPGSAAAIAAWWRPIARDALTVPVVMFAVIMLFSGVAGNVMFMLTIATLSGFESVRLRLQWLQGLAISHRARLLALLTPTVFASVLCIGIGSALPDPIYRSRSAMWINAPSTSTDSAYFNSPTRVPVEYWQVAPSGTAPTIVAEWGGSVEPYTLSVLGVTLYNPFSSREESTKQFVEWQFERATKAVYGRAMTMAQYERDEDAGALPARTSSAAPIRLLQAGGLLAYSLLLVMLAESGRWHLIRRRRILRFVAPAFTIVPMAAMMAIELPHASTHMVASLLTKLFMHLVTVMPANWLVLVLVAALPAVAIYAALEWFFSRAEPSWTPVQMQRFRERR